MQRKQQPSLTKPATSGSVSHAKAGVEAAKASAVVRPTAVPPKASPPKSSAIALSTDTGGKPLPAKTIAARPATRAVAASVIKKPQLSSVPKTNANLKSAGGVVKAAALAIPVPAAVPLTSIVEAPPPLLSTTAEVPPLSSEPEAIEVVSPPPPPPVLDGTIVIRYNHYKPSFKITGGRLAVTAVDEEMFLSHVFKRW